MPQQAVLQCQTNKAWRHREYTSDETYATLSLSCAEFALCLPLTRFSELAPKAPTTEIPQPASVQKHMFAVLWYQEGRTIQVS